MGGKIQGKVTSVSANGNAVTDIPVARLTGVPTDEQVSIHCDGHVTSCIFPARHEQPEMTFLALLGESVIFDLDLVADRLPTSLGNSPRCDDPLRW